MRQPPVPRQRNRLPDAAVAGKTRQRRLPTPRPADVSRGSVVDSHRDFGKRAACLQSAHHARRQGSTRDPRELDAVLRSSERREPIWSSGCAKSWTRPKRWPTSGNARTTNRSFAIITMPCGSTGTPTCSIRLPNTASRKSLRWRKYTGYFDQRERLAYAHPLEPTVARTIGDLEELRALHGRRGPGWRAARHRLRSHQNAGGHSRPAGDRSLDEPRESPHIAELTRGREDMRVVTYVKEADLLMHDVQRVICMGGYNSLLSVVSFEKPALIVPRVQPRMEQFLRAKSVRRSWVRGNTRPHQLSPAALHDWLQRPVSHCPDRSKIDLGGLDRVVEFVQAATNGSPSSRTTH